MTINNKHSRVQTAMENCYYISIQTVVRACTKLIHMYAYMYMFMMYLPFSDTLNNYTFSDKRDRTRWWGWPHPLQHHSDSTSTAHTCEEKDNYYTNYV